MKGGQYLYEREKQEKLSKVSGIVMTLLAFSIAVPCIFFSGFTYLDPPPPEQEQILIEFDALEESPKPRQTWNGSRPRAEEPDRTKKINLVQRSESPVEGTKANEAAESKIDEFGDIETVTPERKKEIDRRALFNAADNKANKDTLAAQTAREISDALKAGHASGNTKKGVTDGEPNAHVKGRSVNGTLPRPSYTVQEEGTVVVDIWVDNYGNVTKAMPGAEGTTVNNRELWNEARKAALAAHFNMSGEAPPQQKGTITYKFKLK